MPSPFTTLGLPATFALDKATLERRYRELQKALHPDRFAQASASERRLSLSRAVEVNEAYRTLRDPLQRASALLATLGWHAEKEPAADPMFLMEMMELRESLSAAHRAGDFDRVGVIGKQTQALQKARLEDVGEAFERCQTDASETALTKVAALLGELRYYRRVLDEVAAIEDEALD